MVVMPWAVVIPLLRIMRWIYNKYEYARFMFINELMVMRCDIDEGDV